MRSRPRKTNILRNRDSLKPRSFKSRIPTAMILKSLLILILILILIVLLPIVVMLILILILLLLLLLPEPLLPMLLVFLLFVFYAFDEICKSQWFRKVIFKNFYLNKFSSKLYSFFPINLFCAQWYHEKKLSSSSSSTSLHLNLLKLLSKHLENDADTKKLYIFF